MRPRKWKSDNMFSLSNMYVCMYGAELSSCPILFGCASTSLVSIGSCLRRLWVQSFESLALGRSIRSPASLRNEWRPPWT